MIHLSAFADEISPDLDEQIAVLLSEDIHFLDLRSVWNINVLDLSDEQVARIKATLDAHKVGVAAIGSPLGKVPIDGPLDKQQERLERAIELAHIFETPFIRIFSFYPPTGRSGAVQPGDYRAEVLRRLKIMAAKARATGITLMHENEKEIYGDTIAHCLDILQSCDEGGLQEVPLQAVFDPANFIQCGQTPFPDAYDALRPWLRYVHVKDALADGTVVAAGDGIAQWPQLLRQLREDGYTGFLSFEPHLAASGQYSGFSGPALFRRAVQALKEMLHAMGWEYA